MKKYMILFIVLCLSCIVFNRLLENQNDDYKVKNYLNDDYQTHYVQYKDILVDKEIYQPLIEMIYDAKELGYSIKVISTCYFLNEKNNTLQDDQYLKDHHQGLGIDIIPSSSDDIYLQQWLIQNSWRYGFILRSYDNPTHYRYVGKQKAKLMYLSNIALEDYLNKK